MTLMELLNQMIHKCRERAAQVEYAYKRGLLTSKEERNKRVQIAIEAWSEIERRCDQEGINLKDEFDPTYQALYESVGISIKKVPVRYYPGVERLTGSLCYLYKVENLESLFNENNVEGKTFKFKAKFNMGDEQIAVDYIFRVKRENFDLEQSAGWEGWRRFSGYGRIEGYWEADAAIDVRENNGVLQSEILQKTYIRDTEPIWKKRAVNPVEGYNWIGFYEEIPENLEIPEGGFYFDETSDPPRGRHYREQGILAYDDTEEIVILGITDPEAEIVEIPREINGKPVTAIDKCCFDNCSNSLRKVILPDTLKEIGDYAFKRCCKLEKPEIPHSVTKTGADLFSTAQYP